MRQLTHLVGVLVLLWAQGTAAASVYDEFTGLRSEAMGGAHRGLGTSNDTLVLNPAGMVMARRYSIDAIYGFTSSDDLNHFSLTAVDSKSGPVAGAVGYTYDSGDTKGANPSLHRIYVAAAYPITPSLGFGFTTQHIRGTFKDPLGVQQDVSLWTGDFGISARSPSGIGFGFAYKNVLNTNQPLLTPPTVGAGVSYSAGMVALAADVNVDIRDKKNKKWNYHVGAEYFMQNEFPLRLGYRSVPYVKDNGNDSRENIWSGGIGWVNQTGGFEGTYTRSSSRGNNWSLMGAFKLYL